jgi:medium-chain acyl-[acyl-carrier-protein] hydrolase
MKISPVKPKNPWIQCPKPNPTAGLRLFCFPYAGGGSLVFYHWPGALPPAIEVCSIQLPGREHRVKEPPFSELRPLLSALESALYVYLDRPFAFFGHSLGALIGFEMARRLRESHIPGLQHLFVSGCRAPHLPDPNLPIRHLPQDAFIRELHQYNGIPKVLLEDPEVMEFFLPLLRADFAIFETYHYHAGDPLDCSITAFGGLEDRKATEHEISQWRAMTLNHFHMRMFPGDHFFLNTQRQALLQVIVEDLHLTWVAGQ